MSNGTVGNGRTTTGVMLSRDGRAAAFDTNATNLVAGANTAEVRSYRAATTALPPGPDGGQCVAAGSVVP